MGRGMKGRDMDQEGKCPTTWRNEIGCMDKQSPVKHRRGVEGCDGHTDTFLGWWRDLDRSELCGKRVNTETTPVGKRSSLVIVGWWSPDGWEDGGARGWVCLQEQSASSGPPGEDASCLIKHKGMTVPSDG